MRYQVTRLDKRFANHDHFKYMLEFSMATWRGTGVLDFDRARRWMNQTWGRSQDVDTRNKIILRKTALTDSLVQEDDINIHWAYAVKYNDYRIYLKDDQALMYFQLAHPSIDKS